MVQNSPKPPETPSPELFAARLLQRWLEEEGDTGKYACALAELCAMTCSSLERGDEAPRVGVDTLEEILLQQGDVTDPAKAGRRLLRSKEFAEYWTLRRPGVVAACVAEGLPLAPELFSPRADGGRSKFKQYLLRFDPVESYPQPDVKAPAEVDAAADHPSGEIRYLEDVATPARWARGWLMRPEGFATRSWRGGVLLAILVFDVAAVFVVTAWAGLLLWLSGPDIGPSVVTALLAAAFAATIWSTARPLAILPTRRLTIAPEWMLGWNQFFGQLILRRGAAGRFPEGSWLCLVRFWGTCPVCSAEVDLSDGGHEFPGRIVGRCADAPMEHVYSFDPTSCTGKPLR